MRKKLISIILAIAMLACMIPMGMVTASAEETHTHRAGDEYMTDGRAHWLKCDNEDGHCDLETVEDYEIAFASNEGPELKELLDYSETCNTYGADTTSMLMGRQGLITDDSVGRTIIPLTQTQLDSIGNQLVIVGGDDSDENNQVNVSVDCAYTYFYDDGNKISAEGMKNAQGEDVAAFVIFDNDGAGNAITGYGYYRIYKDSVNYDNLIGEALYKAPRTFKAVYDTTDGANTLNFYYDTDSHEGEGTKYENGTDNYLFDGTKTSERQWGYFNDGRNIKDVSIDPTVIKYKGLTDTSYMFYEFHNATNISGAEYLDVTNVNNMSSMFYYFGYNFKSLEVVPNVSNWNTKKVEDMYAIFSNYGYNSETLTNAPDVSNWNTENVTDMSYMFENYGSYSTMLNGVPDVSNWNTEEVLTMENMFNSYGYSSKALINAPNVSNWNIENVGNMYGIFNYYGCDSEVLEEAPNVSNWKTTNLYDIELMFSYYGNISQVLDFTLDLSGWDLSNVQNEGDVFASAGSKAKTWKVTIPGMTGDYTNTSSKWYYGYDGSYIELPHGKKFTVAD